MFSLDLEIGGKPEEEEIAKTSRDLLPVRFAGSVVWMPAAGNRFPVFNC